MTEKRLKPQATVYVDLKDVKIPRDYAEPTTKELASLCQSIEGLAQLGAIAITRDKSLIYGLTRLRAADKFGLRARAELWPLMSTSAVDQATIRRMRAAENARRRRLDGSEVERLIAIEMAKLGDMSPVSAPKSAPDAGDSSAEEVPPNGSAGKRGKGEGARGPRKTTRGKARAAVAEQTGATEEAVKKADQRAAKKAASIAQPVDGLRDAAGHVLPEAFRAEYEEAVRLYNSAFKAIRTAQLAVGQLAKMNGVAGLPGAQKWREQLSLLGTEMRNRAPHSICPFCKLHPSLRPECEHCKGVGWVSEAQLGQAHEGLRIFGPEAVVFAPGTSNGKRQMVRVSSL